MLLVELTENSGAVQTVANVFDTSFGFSFGFGSSDARKGEYELKFEVTEQCSEDVFDEARVDTVIDFLRYNLISLPPNYI